MYAIFPGKTYHLLDRTGRFTLCGHRALPIHVVSSPRIVRCAAIANVFNEKRKVMDYFREQKSDFNAVLITRRRTYKLPFKIPAGQTRGGNPTKHTEYYAVWLAAILTLSDCPT